MDSLNTFLTRAEIRKRYGWSLSFIDRRLPRVKIGGKVLVPVAALEKLLSGEEVRHVA